ncbi:10741_t:CDS:10 [Cetraspora pellucida]|uniref:10741_t:CDS:1 n=1 Tax=Cetraspora pellucida TaxID=1433469 RepID=A0A9N9AZY2_9GLOM|nr:10741_t:CDS:10 [Cetraspora pellucida]
MGDDCEVVKNWKSDRKLKETTSINIQNTILRGAQTIRTFNDQTFITKYSKSKKRYREEKKLRKKKSEKVIPNYSELSDGEEIEIESNLKKAFDKEYAKMKDHLKWKLQCTGRVVEDTLYEYVDDPIIQGIFYPQGLQEIAETNVKKDPNLSFNLYENLASFYNKGSIEEIRMIMKEIDHGEYNFEIDTLKYSVHSLIRQYKRNPNAFSLDHYEALYNINVWGPIIDRTVNNIPNVDIVRGESSSFSSSDRKNRNRTVDIRKNGSEVGKRYKEQNATKWLHESGLKLPKMMCDMFVSLCKNAKWDTRKMEKMKTVNLPAGYITRINKSELYRIPEDVESFNDAVELITAVWKSKMRVVNTMSLLNNKER